MGATKIRTTSLDEHLSERTFRMLAETIPHMVWSTRPDGQDDYFNRRLCEYSGMTHEQLNGRGWLSIVHPEDLERCQAVWDRALAQGVTYEIEYRLRRRDGQYRWHLSTAEPLREGGRIVRWFGTCTDIDARKRAEQQLEETLRASERRLREIIDNQPECVKLLDAQCRVLEMNSAGLRMVEADSLDQIRGQTVYPIIASEYREAFSDLVRRVCGGERATLEFEIVGLKGARRWMQTHAAPFVDESSRQTLLLGVTRDITEQRRAEQALAQSEARFRSFMDSMPVIAWIKDGQFRYTWVNAGYHVERQLTLEQVGGRDDFELRDAETARRYREGDEEALRRNAPVQQVIEVRGQKRPEHWLAVRFPLPDAAGRMGVGGIAINISERVELERALRENEKRVTEATETVRQLMSRLVHAQEAERHKLADDLHDLIGQKLTALGINLEFVRQRMPQAGAVALAPRLHQMSTLLEETIASIRQVMGDLHPQALDEHGLSAALFQYASVFEARTGLRVQVKGVDKRLPLPREAAIALFRVAQEALANAAKHSQASVVEMRVTKSAEWVELYIEDDGRGLSEERLSEPTNGRGWGLRMMRERVEAVGGTLRITSPGQGTQIAVKVLLDDADPRHPG